MLCQIAPALVMFWGVPDKAFNRGQKRSCQSMFRPLLHAGELEYAPVGFLKSRLFSIMDEHLLSSDKDGFIGYRFGAISTHHEKTLARSSAKIGHMSR